MEGHGTCALGKIFESTSSLKPVKTIAGKYCIRDETNKRNRNSKVGTSEAG